MRNYGRDPGVVSFRGSKAEKSPLTHLCESATPLQMPAIPIKSLSINTKTITLD